MNPGIGADNKQANDDENEDNAIDADVNNNYATLDDEDGGIIINDGPIEYDEFNIHITMGNFRVGGRHTVSGFYIQLVRPFKQERKKLDIICVLCAKVLYGTNYDQWTWMNCARVITKNTTNLI